MWAIFWVSFGLLWVIVAIQSFAFLELLRQIGQIRQQLGPRQGALVMKDAVNTGGPLPELTGLSAVDLRPARWDDYLGKDFSVVVALTTRCNSCRLIAEELTGFAGELGDAVSIAVLVEGSVDEVANFLTATRLNPRMVIIDEDGITTKAFGINWNPGAVTIWGRKLGEAAIVNDVDQINALIEAKTGRLENAVSR